MPLLSLNSAARQFLAFFLALTFPFCLAAQDASLPQAPQPASSRTSSRQFTLKDYSKPRSAFPNVLAPYRSQDVDPPKLSNTPRIEDLIHDGKLTLSMDDAIALALENNLDIAIARYNLNIADTDILRAKAGDSILGVNAGVVQNTPGGGTGGLSGTVGSGVGGTSIGSAGAGTGTNGLVSSTLGIGVPLTSFDPVLSGTLQADHNTVLSSSSFGVPVSEQNTGTANFSYLQGFTWGTNLSVGFNNSRITSNNPFTSLSPNLTSGFQARVTQHLLQGIGLAPNTRFIRIAKNNREITDVAFRLQVITTVDQIENIYWNLVFAFEDVKVQQEAIAFAQKTLSDTRKQVQFGTLPPIQVVSAQNTVATDQQALILAQTNLQLQELLMKNALTRNMDDPMLADAEVIPTSTMQIPQEEPVVPTQDLIKSALDHRAELAESRIDLSNREISNKAVRNALLPTLDAFAYYGGNGLGGDQNPANICPAPPATQIGCHQANAITPVGYGGVIGDLGDSTAPDKGIGLTLNIPLRNRAAQANQVRAALEYRQAQMRLQQIENQIRIEVRNAQFSLQQNRAAVQAAQVAREFGSQTLDSEQKKLAAGVSNPTAVLQDQSALTSAESNLVSAMAAYEKSRVELDRATGLLLDHAGILMTEAQRGQVEHMPTAPDVAPRPDLPTTTPQPSQPATAPAPGH
jgi:outer membrane protein TolC